MKGATRRPPRRPIFARVYDRLSRLMEREVGEQRDELLAGLSGRVVEIGAGNGMNFQHYPPTVEEVVALEPEPYLRAKAEEAARRAPVRVTVRDGAADPLPLELSRDWLGAAAPARLGGPDRDAALAELARRYLAGHGPATPADLATWAGLPLRDARAGLTSIAGELVELHDCLVNLAARDPGPDRIPARLLPAFDPYLLGWRDRTFAVPSEHIRRVHPGGGVLRATATVDGLAVATWSARRRGEALAVAIDPFGPIPSHALAELHAEAADVATFEGLSLS